MKKFRSVTAAALALTTALALSACTPPHENDGGTREDTATTGPATPSIQSTQEAATDSNESESATESASESASESDLQTEESEMNGMATDSAEATASGAASASGAANQHANH